MKHVHVCEVLNTMPTPCDGTIGNVLGPLRSLNNNNSLLMVVKTYCCLPAFLMGLDWEGFGSKVFGILGCGCANPSEEAGVGWAAVGAVRTGYGQHKGSSSVENFKTTQID